MRRDKGQIGRADLRAVAAHHQVRPVRKAVVDDFVGCGLLLQAAQPRVGAGRAGQVGVLAHALQRLGAAELPDQVRHQRLGRAVLRRHGQPVAQFQRGVAGQRHGHGRIIHILQPGKQRVADALLRARQAALGQRHVGDGHGQAAVALGACGVTVVVSLDRQRRVMAGEVRDLRVGACVFTKRCAGCRAKLPHDEPPKAVERRKPGQQLRHRARAIAPGGHMVARVQLAQQFGVGRKRADLGLGLAQLDAAGLGDLGQHRVGVALDDAAREGPLEPEHVVVGGQADDGGAALGLGNGVAANGQGVPAAVGQAKFIVNFQRCIVKCGTRKLGAQLQRRLPHVHPAERQLLPGHALVVHADRPGKDRAVVQRDHDALGQGKPARQPVGAGRRANGGLVLFGCVVHLVSFLFGLSTGGQPEPPPYQRQRGGVGADSISARNARPLHLNVCGL